MPVPFPFFSPVFFAVSISPQHSQHPGARPRTSLSSLTRARTLAQAHTHPQIPQTSSPTLLTPPTQPQTRTLGERRSIIHKTAEAKLGSQSHASVCVCARVSHLLTLCTRADRAEDQTPQKTAHRRHSSVRHPSLRHALLLHPSCRRGTASRAATSVILELLRLIHASPASRARAL